MTPEHEPFVTDRRSFPKGLLSKNAKVMVMGGLAVAIVLVITVSEKPSESIGPLAVPATAGLNLTPEQVQGLQEKLEAGLERGQLTMAAAPTPVPVPSQPRTGGGSRAAAPALSDAEREDRKKREFESLFASNLVFSQRVDAQKQKPQVAGRQGETLGGDEGPLFQPPALDDVTQSVVKALRDATGGGQGPPAQAAPSAAPLPPTPPPTASTGHRVFEGTIIDAVLANRLDGSLEGPVNALVSGPVFAQDRTLVIPAGARVLGTAKPIQSLDDSRLAVAFHRVVLPNGRDVSLDQFVGMNVRGDVGLSGEVNRHYLSTFGAAAAVGLISGLAQWAGSGFGSASDRTVIVSGIGDSAAQTTAQTMARFLNRRPTITIPEGQRLKVYVTSDLTLPAYGGSR